MDISFEDNQVLIKAPKCLIVLTKAEFVEALKRGKAYRRAQQRSARVAPIDEHTRGDGGTRKGGEVDAPIPGGIGAAGPLGGARLGTGGAGVECRDAVTVGSSPVSPTTNFCLTGDVQTSAQIQVVRGSIYYSLHSASFTPTATNSFRLSETPVQTVYVPDASLLRMVRQGNVDALVVIGCITGR